MKKFFVTMLLAVTLAIIGTQFNQAKATTPYCSATVVSGIDYLSLRSGPSTKYSELARIPPGTRIGLDYESRGKRYSEETLNYLRKRFSYVDRNFIGAYYKGIEGYVHIAYLKDLHWER